LKNPASRPSIKDFLQPIINGNRVVLAQAITLVESQRAEDIQIANQLVEELLPLTGKSMRIAITGVPGVGKSTFIEAFGKHLTAQSKKIAVLAIDPSSNKTKGSILGDKTRMEELAKDPLAFIRPTATGTTLGGVADRTREAILLCEAAGFEIVLVETVGVGQSEVAVRNLVDFFLLLMLAGAGDELQGIKKGIMEMADAIVITKADGDNVKPANQAKADYQHALHLFSETTPDWRPQVITSSALENKGIEETLTLIQDYFHVVRSNGRFEALRKQQNLVWFHESIQQHVRQHLLESVNVKTHIQDLEEQIAENRILPSRAAQMIIKDLFQA
jgi:LAO/AO transport system kinase